MHAMQTTVATTVGSSPGPLAFARDMFSIMHACEYHVKW